MYISTITDKDVSLILTDQEEKNPKQLQKVYFSSSLDNLKEN